MKVEIESNGKRYLVDAEPVEQPKEPTPYKFKVGDKVVIDHIATGFIADRYNIKVGDVATVLNDTLCYCPTWKDDGKWSIPHSMLRPYTEPKPLRQPAVQVGQWVLPITVVDYDGKERHHGVGVPFCVAGVYDNGDISDGVWMLLPRKGDEWAVIDAPKFNEKGTLWHRVTGLPETIVSRCWDNNEWWYNTNTCCRVVESTLTDVCPVKFRVGEKVRCKSSGQLIAWDARMTPDYSDRLTPAVPE